MQLCDAFHIPLRVPAGRAGLPRGLKVERQGIIRHGAKMLYAVSEATVPKLTVVLRKAYGAGYFVMCGRGLRARPHRGVAHRGDLGDGPEGGTNIIFRKEIAAAAMTRTRSGRGVWRSSAGSSARTSPRAGSSTT